MGHAPAVHIDRRPGAPRVALIGVIVVCAVASFALSRVLWPAPAGMAGPPAGLLPWFVALGVLESMLFGLGIAFLLAGRGLVRRAGRHPALSWATYAAIAWMLLSWWPHDNFHRVLDHDDWSGLVRIEYGFHLTLIAASIIVAAYFVDTLRTLR